MPHSQEKAQETSDSILDASIELFIRYGFEKTSMDTIAVAAKVAKGTLYYHFASKEGIVDAIVERYAAEGEARLSAIAADGGKGFVEKLGAAVAVLSDLNNASFSRLHRMKYIDIHAKTGAAMIERFGPLFARMIDEGNREGRCAVEFTLEYAQILLAASQALLDPEAGVEQQPRRLAALTQLAARAFGMDAETTRRIFQPLED
jgi:AcrR family transcriptional regulator